MVCMSGTTGTRIYYYFIIIYVFCLIHYYFLKHKKQQMFIAQMMVDVLKYLQKIQKCKYTLLLAP